MYKIIKKDGTAKRAEFETVHGKIQTPVFMNVATVAAIKGGVSTEDLEGIDTQVVLSNTYHLHLRPGNENVKKLGGLHKFTRWDAPILTDSGGFQVFSLAKLRNIKVVCVEKPTFGSYELVEEIKRVSLWADLDIEFVGFCTDICVVSNALLVKAAFYDKAKISVIENCCAGVTPESHEAALTTMRMCQIDVI